jgi:hypothetical protein
MWCSKRQKTLDRQMAKEKSDRGDMMGSLACVVLENWVKLRIGSVVARSGWTYHEEAPRFSPDGGKLDEIHAWHYMLLYSTKSSDSG